MPVSHIFEQWWDNLAQPAMNAQQERTDLFRRQYDTMIRGWQRVDLDVVEKVVTTLKEQITKLPPPIHTKESYIDQLTRESAVIGGKPLKLGYTWRVPSVKLTFNKDTYDLGRAVVRLDKLAQFQTAFELMPHPHSTTDSHKSMRKLEKFCLSAVAHAVRHAITYGQLATAVHMCNRQLPIYTPTGQHFPLGAAACPNNICGAWTSQYSLHFSGPGVTNGQPVNPPVTCLKCKTAGCSRCMSPCQICNGPCRRCHNRKTATVTGQCICTTTFWNAWLEYVTMSEDTKRATRRTFEEWERYGYYGDIHLTISRHRDSTHGTISQVYPAVVQRLAGTVPPS